jgi:hypothetical protein
VKAATIGISTLADYSIWLKDPQHTPIWLNHDYGDGGVADILAVDAYSAVEVCTPIFLGEASK